MQRSILFSTVAALSVTMGGVSAMAMGNAAPVIYDSYNQEIPMIMVGGGGVTHSEPVYTSAPEAVQAGYHAAPYGAVPVLAPASTAQPIYVETPVIAPPMIAPPALDMAAPRGVAVPEIMSKSAGWGSKVYIAPRLLALKSDESVFGTLGTRVESDYDTGFGGSIAIGTGRQMGWGALRSELEFGYQRAGISEHNVVGTLRATEEDAFGSSRALFGFANLYGDLALTEKLDLTAGGGLGVGRVSLEGQGVSALGVVMDDSDTALGYHLDAGLSYDVTEAVALEALYRFQSFVNVELDARDGTASDVDVDSHQLSLGARIGF